MGVHGTFVNVAIPAVSTHAVGAHLKDLHALFTPMTEKDIIDVKCCRPFRSRGPG